MYEIILTADFVARFWERVDHRPQASSDACWPWMGYLKHGGYGQVSARCPDGRWWTLAAHRVAYEMTKGPVDPDALVCHTCDNPPCVRPSHLWLGTNAANSQDMITKGRWGGGPVRLVTVAGVTKCAGEWAHEKEMPARVLRHRLSTGWTDEEAVLTPWKSREQARAEKRAALAKRYGLKL